MYSDADIEIDFPIDVSGRRFEITVRRLGESKVELLES